MGYQLVRDEQGIRDVRFFQTEDGAYEAFIEDMREWLSWGNDDNDPKWDDMTALVEKGDGRAAMKLWDDYFEDKYQRDTIWSVEYASIGR